MWPCTGLWVPRAPQNTSVKSQDCLWQSASVRNSTDVTGGNGAEISALGLDELQTAPHTVPYGSKTPLGTIEASTPSSKSSTFPLPWDGWFLGYPKSITCRLRGKQLCSNRCKRPVVVAAEYLPMLFCIPTACSVPHTVATKQEGRVVWGATTLQTTMLLALQGGETALEKALPQWSSSSSSLAWSRNLLLSLRLGSKNQSWTQRQRLDSPWDPIHSVPALCYAHKPKARSWGKSL